MGVRRSRRACGVKVVGNRMRHGRRFANRASSRQSIAGAIVNQLRYARLPAAHTQYTAAVSGIAEYSTVCEPCEDQRR